MSGKKYIMRLDDASDYMDLEKWNRMEKLLDTYNIKPIFGIIPKNGDQSLISKYEKNPHFWELMHRWIDKNWTPAMHGYEHRYITEEGGLNPVNKRSEFAGLSYDEQREKIRKGYQILLKHNIMPDIFFAPSHTFDDNTLRAIKEETPIRIISDTVAWDVYQEGEIIFIPQQSGNVRRLPFRTVTFCYHPNTMDERAFVELERFFNRYYSLFQNQKEFGMKPRGKTLVDVVMQKIYFLRR